MFRSFADQVASTRLEKCECGASLFSRSENDGCRVCRGTTDKILSVEEVEAMRPEWNRGAAQYRAQVRRQMAPVIMKISLELERQKTETPQQTESRRGYCYWYRGKGTV